MTAFWASNDDDGFSLSLICGLSNIFIAIQTFWFYLISYTVSIVPVHLHGSTSIPAKSPPSLTCATLYICWKFWKYALVASSHKSLRYKLKYIWLSRDQLTCTQRTTYSARAKTVFFYFTSTATTSVNYYTRTYTHLSFWCLFLLVRVFTVYIFTH